MVENVDGLKSEMEGTNGLISKVRKSLLPDSPGMAKRARVLAKSRVDGFDSPDTYLSHLISCEYEIYLGIEERIFSEFISRAYSISNEDEHPIFRGMVESLSSSQIGGTSDILSTVGNITPIIKILSESSSQSRKTRSGKGFAIHVESVMRGFSVVEGVDYAKSDTVPNLGRTLEYVFPAVEGGESGIRFFGATKTTINDSLRSIYNQLPGNSESFIFTPAGSEVYGKRGRVEKLPGKSILKEGARKGVKFVTIMEDRIEGIPDYIISYSDFIGLVKP